MSTEPTKSDRELLKYLTDIVKSTRVQDLIDHTNESTLISLGEVDVVCSRCQALRRVIRQIDDWGNAQTSGAVRIQGRWVCDACEFDAACDYATALAEQPFHDVPGPDWFPLPAAEVERMELDELADQGFLDPTVASALDSWPSDRPEAVSDADQEWFRLETSGAEIIGLGYSDVTGPDAL